MFYSDRSIKNCLQWGLRVISPERYHRILIRYATEVDPSALDRIRGAHYRERGGKWWLRKLYCDISDKKVWINIATGRRVASDHSRKIATFSSWIRYEHFREAIRDSTEKHFRPYW